MPTCTICSQKFHAAPPVLAPACPNCGFNMVKPESLGGVGKKIAQLGETKMRSESICSQINALYSTGSDDMTRKRIKRFMIILTGMHAGADWVGRIIDEAPAPTRAKRVLALDNALKGALDPSEGQEMFGTTTHASLAANSSRAVDHCRQGLNVLKQKWPTFSDTEKKLFCSEAFLHDKGYPAAVQSMVNFVPPSQATVAASLLKILYSATNTNPYTNGPGPTRELGEAIKAGWATATAQQKNAMWFNVMFRIGKDFGLTDGDEILAKLKENRSDVVEQLTPFTTAHDAGRFVDEHAAAAWKEVMG